MSDKNVWYLSGPIHRYNEDVKALAKQAGLRIIDADVTDSREGEADEVPEVTLRELPGQGVLVVGGHDSGELAELIERLNAERDLIITLIESAEGLGPLEHPGAGELPIRLFDALDHIRSQIGELAESRGKLAADNEQLRSEIEALKAAAEKAKAAAKAKPIDKAQE